MRVPPLLLLPLPLAEEEAPMLIRGGGVLLLNCLRRVFLGGVVKPLSSTGGAAVVACHAGADHDQRCLNVRGRTVMNEGGSCGGTKCR